MANRAGKQLTAAQLEVLAYAADHGGRGRVWIRAGWPTTFAIGNQFLRMGLVVRARTDGQSVDVAYKLTDAGRMLIAAGRMFAGLTRA